MAVEGRKRDQQTDSAWCQANYVARALVPAIWILITMQPTTQARSAADDEKAVGALDIEYQAAVKKNDVATMDRIWQATLFWSRVWEKLTRKRICWRKRGASARFTNVNRIAPGKCGSGAILQLLPRCCGQREPKMANRSTISFGLATPMFGLRLAGAMSLPRPRPVCRRRLEFGVTVDV
jgi:hypothetical protein